MNEKRNFSDIILDLIYPPKCGICGKLDNNFLCPKCYKMLKNDAKFSIEKSTNSENEFNKHLYIFKYEGVIRKILIQYKFQEKSYLYKAIINFLLNNKKIFEFIKCYDTIIPVPISKERKKKRGYNQSFLLAKEISKKVGIKVENKCLFKNKNVIEQSKLNKEDRLKNIQGVYEIKNHKKLQGKKILLLDDIYTTGSTVNECCRVLKKANPVKIDVLTIAKD